MNKSKLFIHLIAVFSAYLFFIITYTNNLRFSPDSMAYLEVSNNFASGNGAVFNSGQPLIHWPPLYPLLLATLSQILNISTLNTGIYLNTGLLYIYIVTFYFILRELKLNQILSVGVSILLLLSQSTLVFGQYLSEGLFMVCWLLSLFFFINWLNSDKLKFLLFTGVFCGLLLLTRYAGIGLVGGFILYITTYRKSIQEKLLYLFVLLIPLVIILIPWFLYLNSFDLSTPIRSFANHLIGIEKLKSFITTISYWFVGSAIARVILIFLLIISIIILRKHLPLLIQNFSKTIKKRKKELFLISCLLIVYIGFLFISISFYDSYTPLDNRILSPIFPLLLITIVLFISSFKKTKNLRIIFYLSFFLLFVNFIGTAGNQWLNHYNNGSGYSSKIWSCSKTLTTLTNLPNNKTVYTNGIEILELHTNIESKLLPQKKESLKLKEIKSKVKNKNFKIVYFNNVNWRNYLITKELILEEFKGFNIINLNDGFIICN